MAKTMKVYDKQLRPSYYVDTSVADDYTETRYRKGDIKQVPITISENDYKVLRHILQSVQATVLINDGISYDDLEELAEAN